MYSAFCKRLKELRFEKGITQQQLGIAFGVDQRTISDWELRGCEPNYQTLIVLAEFFEVSTDYLLGKEE